MTTDNDYLKNLSNDGFSYADSHQRYKVQLPLMLSYPSISGSRDPNDLYRDNAEYLAYPSGIHQTMVATNQQDRYGSFTITSSGVFSVYLQVSEYAVDSNPAFIGAPTVISGEGGSTDLIFATYYEDTPFNPSTYSIPITTNGTHSIVFPFPVTSKAFLVTHSGDTNYSISQLIPRKLVQRYDIEVNSIKAYHVSSTLIDTIALQVSDSIVVGPELIGAKSIDGSKIVDGTVSGVLIANGTVTGNKVQAGTISGVLIAANTITANNLSVDQLDAVAANMGNLIVNSGISIGTEGYLWAGAGSASSPTNGLKIYTSDGISRLTTFSGGIAQVDIGSDGKLYAGSGQTLKLDSTGMTFKTGVFGRNFFAGPATPPDVSTNPTYPPISNLIKFKPFYYTTTAANTTTFYDYNENVSSFMIGATQQYTNSTEVGEYPVTNVNFNGVDAVIRAGWLPTESTASGYIATHQSSLSLLSNASQYSTLLAATKLQKLQFDSEGTKLEDATGYPIAVSGNSVRLTAGSNYLDLQNFGSYFSGQVRVTGDLSVNTDRFTVNSTTGNATIAGTLDVASNFTVNNNKFTVVPGNGNTHVDGTLTVHGNAHFGTGSHTVIIDSATGDATFEGTITAAGFNLTSGGKKSPYYGSGFDGAVNFNAPNEYMFATYDSNTSTYTLTRDVFASTVFVAGGVTVKSSGFRIFATTSITVDGTVSNNGGNASGVTAGVGALGGYFKAATAGGAGLGTTIAGSVGSVAVQPTSSTFVGMLGGRGAGAPASINTFVAVSSISKANYDVITPADVDGGKFIINDIASWSTRALALTTTLWQMSPSIGGASGSKSVTGTGATSGGGGGGGGFVFLASPTISGTGAITAKGGNGGNGVGTGGNFGGGGGGGGGIIAIVTDHSTDVSTLTDVSGGLGGSSTYSINRPLAFGDSSSTSTTSESVTIYPVTSLSKNTLYILSIHVQGTAGSLPTVNEVNGAGCEWAMQEEVLFNSTATPTRRLSVWIGRKDTNVGYNVPFSDDPRLRIDFSAAPVSVRYNLDQIQNTALAENLWPIVGAATNRTDSAANITTDLGYTPTTNNLQYTVVARSGGTTPVAGTGNTLVNNQTVAPLLVSEASLTRQTNTMSWTTAAAAAAVTLDLSMPSVGEPGTNGEDGKVIMFYV